MDLRFLLRLCQDKRQLSQLSVINNDALAGFDLQTLLRSVLSLPVQLNADDNRRLRII